MPLTTVTLEGGVEAALALVPAAAGVGQILAGEDRNLVIGRPSNLRQWAAGHLGRARPAKVVPGQLPRRPPTDLTPIAASIAYVRTASGFGQRLAFERLMARYVPLAQRRDLKRPAYLRVEDGDPLPRIVVQAEAGSAVFGPFRDTRAATRARDALDKHFRIRPCDFGFQAPVDVPRGLAAEIARALDAGVALPEIPAWVRRGAGRSLIVEGLKNGYEIHPVVGGTVVDDAGTVAAADGLEDALAGLDWNAVVASRDDTPWLNGWRHGKHTGVEIRVDGDEPASTIAARVRRALGRDASAVGGMVG